MNKKSLRSSLLLGILLLPMYAGAQSIKIQGTVVAESDGEPLPGVTVSIDGTNIATLPTWMVTSPSMPSRKESSSSPI